MNHTITITKLKHYAALSEETNCFTCTVLLDGKPTWYAENRGQGGSTNVQWLKTPSDAQRAEHDMGKVEELVDQFVEDAIMEKHKEKDKKTVARKLSKGLFFRTKGQKENSYYSVKTPTPNDPAIRERILGKRKDEIDVIINDLPIHEAVKYFFVYN